MIPNRQPCKFFAQGRCIYADKCKNEHIPNTGSFQNTQNQQMTDKIMPTKFQNQTDKGGNSNICRFFLQGKCVSDPCRFFHGYGENLQHMTMESVHDKPIVSLCQISEKKFLTADESCFKIWIIEEKYNLMGTQNFEGEKITKVIYSNDKIIVATRIEQMYALNKRRLYQRMVSV